MAEPNIKSTVYNTDITYTPTPIDTGIKILGFLKSPTGSFDIRKTKNVSDLINHYLTKKELEVSNDNTVLQSAYLANLTPIYTKRLGKMGLRQGLSSTGELLLFDSNNDLIKQYYELSIEEWLDTLDYYYVAYGSYMWYTGDISNLSEDLDKKYPRKIKVSDIKSVDILIENLYQFISSVITILKTNGTSILCRDVLSFSNNLSVNTVENFNMFKLISNSEENKLISMGDFIKIRDTTYYWQGNGSFKPLRYSNPVPIYSKGEITTTYDSGLFLFRVLKKIQEASTSYEPMPEIRGNGGLCVTYKGVQGAWKISEDCQNKLKITNGDKILGIFDADDYITQGTVELLFYKEPKEPEGDILIGVDIEDVSEGDNTVYRTKNKTLATDNKYYRITIEALENIWNWEDNIAVINNGDNLVWNVNDIQSLDTYNILIDSIISDDTVEKNVIISFNNQEIERRTLDFKQDATLTDIELKNLNFTANGNVRVTFEGCTLTNATVKRIRNSKQKDIVVYVGDKEYLRETVSFKEGDILNQPYIIDNIKNTDIGKLSVEMYQANFNGIKFEEIIPEVLTEIDIKGLDIGFNFVIGESLTPTPIGYNEIILTEEQLNGLEIINAILDTLEVSQSEDFELDASDFKFYTQGKFTAFFDRKELIEKGTSTDQDIKCLNVELDKETITYQYDFLSDSYMKGSKTNTDFHILIDNVLFYVGRQAPSIEGASYKAQLSKTPVTYSQFLSLFEDSLYSYFDDVCMYQNNFTFIGNIKIESKGVNLKLDRIKQLTSAKFVILQNFTSESNSFSVSFKKQEDAFGGYEVYELTLGYKDNYQSYDISFDEAAVDGFLRSLYYKEVKNDFLSIMELKDGHAILDELNNFKFGRDIKPKNVNTADILSAIDSLEMEENYYFDFIWDTGMANPTIARAIDKICRKKFSFNIISLPPEYEYDKVNKSGYPKLTKYLEGLAMDSEYSRYLWAAARESVGGNFATLINGSTMLLKQYINNYNKSGTMFCPQMGVNYGQLQANHLILPEVAVRDDLIDRFRCATIKGGVRHPYHINDNTTTQSFLSPYREEQNVRIANTIIHGAEQIFYTYLGLKNDYITRDSLVSKILTYINNTCVVNQIFSLDQVRVVCDESNNTNEDVANGRLNLAIYAKFGRAIKYGLIYLHSLSLDE